MSIFDHHKTVKGKSIQEVHISMNNYCRKWQREYIAAVNKSIADKTDPPPVKGIIISYLTT